MFLLDWWVKLVERDVLLVVRDVHLLRQLLDLWLLRMMSPLRRYIVSRQSLRL